MPTKTSNTIRELLNERKIYSRVFGLKESRTVYNPLIKHHLNSPYRIRKVKVSVR